MLGTVDVCRNRRLTVGDTWLTIPRTRRSASKLATMRPAGVVGAVFAALMIAACGGSSSPVQISYRSFIEQIQAGNVRSISAAGRAISGRFKHPVTYPPTASTKTVNFSVEIPTYVPKAPVVRLLKRERVRVSGLGRSS